MTTQKSAYELYDDAAKNTGGVKDCVIKVMHPKEGEWCWMTCLQGGKPWTFKREEALLLTFATKTLYLMQNEEDPDPDKNIWYYEVINLKDGSVEYDSSKDK